MASYLNVGFINCYGQSGLKLEKIQQISKITRDYQLDIINMQETHCDADTFEHDDFLFNNFNLIFNNSPSKYGTSSLISSSLIYNNPRFDDTGRVIVFDVPDLSLTIGNVYLPCGSDSTSKNRREDYCSRIIPSLLLDRLENGNVGGDWNSITNKRDCTKNPDVKICKSMKNMTDTLDLKDDFRTLWPNDKSMSHYYFHPIHGPGATRIDRSYTYGGLKVATACYISASFSDHCVLIISLELPQNIGIFKAPKTFPHYKIKPYILSDPIFKQNLSVLVEDCVKVTDLNTSFLESWEWILKPGIIRLAKDRQRELELEKFGRLNVLFIKQNIYTAKLHQGDYSVLSLLRKVQLEIEAHYESECNKIRIQARMDECTQSEKTRIYHHSLLKRNIKRSAILKLDTLEGMKTGHDECMDFLERDVMSLLFNVHSPNMEAVQDLLDEISPSFSTEDNKMLEAAPTEKEIKKVISSSNLSASPGLDGIPGSLYSECWETIKRPLVNMIQEVHKDESPTLSQRTSLMTFCKKPKRALSFKPGDMRRISLINSDMKIITGVDAARFQDIAGHTLSKSQLVAGTELRIHHGINYARDAIHAINRRKGGAAILDLDFLQGFDWLIMSWVYQVLAKKGVSPPVIARLNRIYANNFTIISVNNRQGKRILNKRGSLRQGDRPSMYWFCVAIDPLLNSLNRRLAGILIRDIPIQGPLYEHQSEKLILKDKYSLISYADDLKPAVTSIEEINICINECSKLEGASGVKLHRDPASGKVKILPLGKWRTTLRQDDIPFDFIKISDVLDCVGVKLYADHTTTRRVNGEALVEKVAKTINPWKGGRFMALLDRAHAINSNVLSKIWYICGSVMPRAQDIKQINRDLKAWLFQDLCSKPSDVALYRSTDMGGLGLFHVESRCQAMHIRSFLETAANPCFRHSPSNRELFLQRVRGEAPNFKVELSPSFNKKFFEIMKKIDEMSGFTIEFLTIKEIYSLLLDNNKLLDQENVPIPLHCETKLSWLDWGQAWEMIRLRGLNPEAASTCYKIMHEILPTKHKVDQMSRNKQPSQGKCTFCPQHNDDVIHALTLCSRSLEAAQCLLKVIKKVNANITLVDAVFFQGDFGVSPLPLAWIISTSLHLIWSSRPQGGLTATKLMSELIAKSEFLSNSKYDDDYLTIHRILHN